MRGVFESGRGRRGSAFVLFTMMVPLLIVPMVGLAIDGVLLYSVKAKLVSAVDGGAIAAARSLNVGLDFDSQKTAAAKTAEQFVRANFPTGYWRARNLTLDPPVDVQEDTTTSFKRRTVAVTAAVDVPLYFMPILGRRMETVGAYGKAARRDVRMVIVLDKSSSMAGTAMTRLKSAARDFVSKFASGRDQLGLVVFQASAVVAFPPFDPPSTSGGTGPLATFKTASPNMDSLIAGINANSNTGMAEGLWLAYQELLKTPLVGALNVIVLFTDGLPNGITAKFNETGSSVIKSTSPCTYKTTADPTKVMIGVMAQWGAFSTTPSSTNTVGLFRPINAPDGSHSTVAAWLADTNTDPTLSGTPTTNCSFTTGVQKLVTDIGSFPTADLYGNATNGPGYIYSRHYRTSGVALNMNGVNVPYQVGLVSWNAVDDAARRIRADLNINPVIYTIGLEGAEGADSYLMKRVSNVNDPTNLAYEPSRPPGKYFPAPDPSYIQQAFTQVAAEILRLTN